MKWDVEKNSGQKKQNENTRLINTSILSRERNERDDDNP